MEGCSLGEVGGGVTSTAPRDTPCVSFPRLSDTPLHEAGWHHRIAGREARWSTWHTGGGAEVGRVLRSRDIDYEGFPVILISMIECEGFYASVVRVGLSLVGMG